MYVMRRGVRIRDYAVAINLPTGAEIISAEIGHPEDEPDGKKQLGWCTLTIKVSQPDAPIESRRFKVVESGYKPKRDSHVLLATIDRHDQKMDVLEIRDSPTQARNMQFTELHFGANVVQLTQVAFLNVLCPLRIKSLVPYLCWKRDPATKRTVRSYYTIVLAGKRSQAYGEHVDQALTLVERGLVRSVETPQEPAYSLWVDVKMLGLGPLLRDERNISSSEEKG